MINMVIDGRQVQAQTGWTVLETARQNGIHIPTLCHHEAVEPSGACRLCVVEIGDETWSKIVISCMYPVAEGLNVKTDSPRVKNVRRWILENDWLEAIIALPLNMFYNTGIAYLYMGADEP